MFKNAFIAAIIGLTAGAVCCAADPILVAHRGMLRHAPENTLPAFAACCELGVGIELDIRTSRDGQLVVLHDNTLARTTNGPDRSVREFTLKELKAFDAGSWFAPSFSGAKIPTFEEALKLISTTKRGKTILALNIKDITPAGEKEFVQLVAKYGLLDESFAFDQSPEISHRLKKLNPRMRVGQNVSRRDLQSRLDEGLLDVFLVTFAPTAEETKFLHQHKKLVVYNFGGSGDQRRNPKVWSMVREASIDGMLTDFPLECRLHWRGEGATDSGR